MFEQIDIPEKLSCSTARCDCGNTEWYEVTIEVKPVVAGKLILCWEIKMGLECNKCKLYALHNIGIFDDDLKLLKEFPSYPDYVRRLRELNIQDKVFSSYQNLIDSYRSLGVSKP